MDVRAALADVAELGPFFTIGTDPAGTDPAGTDPAGTDPAGTDPAGAQRGWRPVAELYADPRPLRDRIAHVRRALNSDDRVAASITFQGVAALLVSAPFAAVVLHGVLPRLTARTLYWRPTDRGPWTLRCPDPTGTAVPATAEGAAALAELLVEQHLAPLVAAVRAQVPIAERLLWGNVASSVAAGKRVLSVERPAAAGCAARVAARLLASGPLAGTGELLAPSPPDRHWSFRRRSCCLYYRVPGGGLCGDCVLQARR